MSTIMPEGEEIRRAVKWVSGERVENPRASLASLIETASRRFDLSPKEEQFLFHFFTEGGECA
jgi:hypothetical protein